jgi:predicted NACHT family NTPase
VVLGLASYQKVKADPHAKAILQCFTLGKTLLFVGCGDTVLDPNFKQLITWGTEVLKDVAPRHRLLCRASEMSAFQQKLAPAPWLQPIAYGDDYAELGPFLRSLVPAGASAAAAISLAPGRLQPVQAPSLDLSGYRQAIARHYGHLKLEELDATSSDMPRGIRVTEVFIPPSVRECEQYLPRAMELPKELQRRLREQGTLDGTELEDAELARLLRTYLDQSLQPMLEVLADPSQRKLVVLGDPGSGKSLLLQYLVLAWAEAGDTLLGDAPLPLLIELRDYASRRAKGEVNGILDYLGRAESLRWRLDPEALEHWLRHNRTQVLFDGLDEVFDPELRQEVTTAIHRFADDYPAAQIVVSSRLIGFPHERWRQEGFRPFMLQELDQEQTELFLRRWHQLAYEDESKGERKRASLLQAIHQSPAIQQLAGNPLLLTLMAILNRSQELPRDRGELYSQCARLLLHQWKTEQAFEASPELAQAHLDGKDKLGLMKRIASTLQAGTDGAAGNLVNLIEETQLERTLSEGLQGVPGLRPARAARALIEQLRGRNFMLCFMGCGNYAFVHRTFLEYFCAEAIVDRFQVDQTLTLDALKTEIFGHWPDESWHEVLRLVAGRIATKFLNDILLWLVEQPDPSGLCQNIFLAAQCVGEVRNRDNLEGAENTVLDKLKMVATSSLDLFLRQSDQIDRAIFKEPTEQQAIRLVGKIWQDDPETEAWLYCLAQSSDNPMTAFVSFAEFMKMGTDDEDMLNAIRSLAQSSRQRTIRIIAIGILVNHFDRDDKTLAIIKELAKSDQHEDVRIEARGALALGWKEDPAIQVFLDGL